MMLTEKMTVLGKTHELCQQILEDKECRKMLRDVETFMADDAARTQYKALHERGEELNHKQQAGLELSDHEVREFEGMRDQLFANKIASDFMSAQRALEALQQEIGRYVGMTMELGRVPTADEIEQMSGGGCCGGGGCGCA